MKEMGKVIETERDRGKNQVAQFLLISKDWHWVIDPGDWNNHIFKTLWEGRTLSPLLLWSLCILAGPYHLHMLSSQWGRLSVWQVLFCEWIYLDRCPRRTSGMIGLPYSHSSKRAYLILCHVGNMGKTSISALLTMPKPLTVWITINCGKFWKRWEYQTTWTASWETYMQVRKQQTGSK